MTDITYYIAVLLLIIIGVFLIKKVAGCIIKIIITVVLIAICAIIYLVYFKGEALPM